MRRTCIAVSLALLSLVAHADTLTGRVVGISDGDTLTLLDMANVQHRVRLSGIDSPEKGQAYGKHCKESLSELAHGHAVTVESVKQDRYGRVIGKVFVGDQDINLEQIRRGCAWHYKKYQNEQILDDRLVYAEAEASAKAAKLGLWAEPEPLAPWAWRKARRE